jgi:hypothetical protein
MISKRLGVTSAIAASIAFVFLACSSSSSDANNPSESNDDAGTSSDARSNGDAKIGDAGAVSLSVSPATLDFGSIVLHDASMQGVVVTNGSSIAVAFSSPSIAGNEFSVDAAGFPNSLAPGEHASLGIVFDPTEAGVTSGTLVLTPALGKPLDVALSGKGIHAVDVTWTASVSPDIAGYNLYRGTVSGGPYPDKINTALIPGTFFEDTTVMSCTTYYYVATAVELLGDGGQSESGYSNEYGAAIPCD